MLELITIKRVALAAHHSQPKRVGATMFAQEAPATPAENRRALETIILCAGIVQGPARQ